MNKAKPYLQAAALVSSVLMVGAFIGCRTGTIQPLGKADPRPAAPQPPAAQPTPEGKPTLMPGSKSLMIDLRANGTPAANPPGAAPPPTPPAPEKKQQFIIMGGPKSAPVFAPTPADQPNTPPGP